jgi:cell division cycle 2-like protein
VLSSRVRIVFGRDLKTSNILYNNKGDLKICDLGLARQYGSPLRPYTHMVVTLWYRAPELLLGQRLYSTGVDVWSLGCIMGELLCKDPLFQGKTEIDQIDRIFRLLGTPNEKIWPNFVNLPSVRKIKFPHQPYNNLRKKFPKISPNGGVTLSDAGFDLLNKLLAYDPDRRMTCEEALGHEFFREFPPAKAKELMPTYPSKAAGQTREVVERAKAAARARNAELRAIEAMEGEDPLETQRRREEAMAGRERTGLFSHLN